jgi:multidrug resistance protein, MATE family
MRGLPAADGPQRPGRLQGRAMQKRTDKRASRLSWRAELAATLSLGSPLILTNLAQTGLTTADVILMGWLGSHALAAGALGTNIYFALLIFGMGLVTATAPLIAQELGRKRHSVRDVRRTVRQGLWTAVAISVPVWLVLWNAEALLLVLGQEPALAAEAAPYVRTLQWAFLPFLGAVVLRSFLSALERPRWVLFMGLLALPLNIAVAWAFMFGSLGLPALGLAGAGVATTVASLFIFSGLAVVILTDRKLRRYRLFGRFWRADWRRFRTIWRIGLPIGGTLLFEVGLFNAAAFVMGLFGPEPLAAHAIALQIASLTFMVPLGLAQAATVRVGLAYGARDAEGIRRAGWTAYALGVGFMALVALLMMAFPRSLAGIFLDAADPKNAAVIAYAVTFLGFAALFQVVDGAQAVGAGILRGLNDTRTPMLYAALGYWGIGASLGIALAFPAGLKGAGIWIGLATGLATVAALMLWRWSQRTELGLVAEAAPPRVQAPAASGV